MRRLASFTIVSMILFGLLALPNWAGKSRALSGKHTSPQLEASSGFSAQLTFTPAFTIYLPLVLYPPNSLEITTLVFLGDDEFIEIKNNGPGNQLLDGWQIESEEHAQTYDFPIGITLGVDQTVRVHSGSMAIDNPPSDLLWTTEHRVWKNTGDTARLKDNQGIVRDTFCYRDGCL